MIRNSLFLLVILCSTVFANPNFFVVDGDTITLTGQITVVGSRVPVAMPGIVRSVAVIDPVDIEVNTEYTVTTTPILPSRPLTGTGSLTGGFSLIITTENGGGTMTAGSQI